MRIFRLIGAASLILASYMSASAFENTQAPSSVDWTTVAKNEFYIATVHIDGSTNINGDAAHPPESFPSSPLPRGGGLIRTPPDENGTWKMRAFVFSPAQVTVHQGETLTLHFVGVQGPSHRIAVEGHDEIINLKRGEEKSITFKAEKPGIIRFISIDRQPSMQGQIIVLP